MGRGLAVGTGRGVGVGLGPPCTQYLPPVFKSPLVLFPPQTIIPLPPEGIVCTSGVQTAVWCHRATGALVALVAVQLSVLGLYLPPVFK